MINLVLDVDGVLLRWLFCFDKWMLRQGFEVINPDVPAIEGRYSGHEDISKLSLRARQLYAVNIIDKFNESGWGKNLPMYNHRVVPFLSNLKKYNDNIEINILTAFGDTKKHYDNRSDNLLQLGLGQFWDSLHLVKLGQIKKHIYSQLHIEKDYHTRHIIIEDNYKAACDFADENGKGNHYAILYRDPQDVPAPIEEIEKRAKNKQVKIIENHYEILEEIKRHYYEIDQSQSKVHADS